MQTPVALFIFNRPDLIELVFAEIAKAKPSKLLVVADGAKKEKTGEMRMVVLYLTHLNIYRSIVGMMCVKKKPGKWELESKLAL